MRRKRRGDLRLGQSQILNGPEQLLGVNGLGDVAVMPASRQRSRSPFMAWAVSAMIGMRRPVGARGGGSRPSPRSRPSPASARPSARGRSASRLRAPAPRGRWLATATRVPALRQQPARELSGSRGCPRPAGCAAGSAGSGGLSPPGRVVAKPASRSRQRAGRGASSSDCLTGFDEVSGHAAGRGSGRRRRASPRTAS